MFVMNIIWYVSDDIEGMHLQGADSLQEIGKNISHDMQKKVKN